MDMYVPDYDKFQEFINILADKYPDDGQIQMVKGLVEAGVSPDGESHFAQLSADGSNIRPEATVFSVLSIHEDPFSYPEDFFENYQLVITFNFESLKMDVFCGMHLDPEEVCGQLMTMTKDLV